MKMDLFNTNTSTLKQIPLTCNGHTRPIVHLEYSRMIGDQCYLISASKDGNPMVRNGATGDWEGTLYGHKGAVWGVAWNSDATIAATASADFTAKIWAINNKGNEIHTFMHKHIVRAVDFSSDDKKLLTASNDRKITMSDLTSYDSEPQTFLGHEGNIRDVYFISRDDSCFVSASEDKTVQFWDKRTGKSQKELRFEEMPYSAEVTVDKSLLSICHGTKVSFYGLDTMNKLAEFRVPTEVYSASMSPNKDTFVCGGEDFVIYKYDIKSQTQIEQYQEHFGAVHCVRYSPDGEVYASGSEDGTLRLWQNTVGKEYGLWSLDRGADNNGLCVN